MKLKLKNITILIIAVIFGFLSESCDSGTNFEFGINPGNPSFSSSNPLTTNDVRLIIQQAVTKAVELGIPISVAVVDRGGTVLGFFQMDGAPITTVIGSQNPDNIVPIFPTNSGLELIGLDLPQVVQPILPPKYR